MSWLKNLKKIFGSNENEEYDDYENPVSNQHEKINGQIETKVTYQYPKGNFRFPLNLDNGVNRSRNNTSEPIRKPKNHAIVDKPVERKVNKPIEKSTSRIRQEKVQPKIQPKIKQPFRPTEIPSPIYGFNRPPRRNKPNLKDQNEESLVGETEIKDRFPYNEIEVKTVHTNNMDVNGEPEQFNHLDMEDQQIQLVNVEEEDAQSYEIGYKELYIPLNEMKDERLPKKIQLDIEEEVGQTTNKETINEELNNLNEFEIEGLPTQQNEMGEPFLERNEPIINEPIINESDIQTNVETIEEELDSVSEWEIVSEAQLNEMEEEEPFLEQNELIINESDIQTNEETIEEELDSVNEWEIVSQAQLNEMEEEEPFFMEQDQFDDDLDWEDSQSSDEPHSNQDPNSINEPSVRTHIPFNVIMLKKDREKLSNSQIVNQATMEKAQIEAAAAITYEEENLVENYVFPSRMLLNPSQEHEMDKQWVLKQSDLLDETLLNFNVRAKVVNVSQGPSVTRFEVQPEPGVKVNKITNLSDDIKLSLAAKDIRIEAPIPGKHTIGIELPNAKSRPVYLSEIISSEIFQKSESPLTAALGLDISGKPVITDLRKMPHGLIAGATGSGKSVCINSILVSLLYKSTPDELKLLMIDPKMVELAPYNHIPHLVSPVITDVKAATAALKWAVEEMERRYELFAHTGVREIQRYNEMAEQNRQFNQKLPFIVIVIDELADLMMMAPADVEEAICRIAQKARACGIHLIIATQRPSVDVITGLIKANVPTRIAFSVSSQVDSRTIIDISGAEKLLGRGDMLFLENGTSKPVRLQGTYVSDEEIDQVVAHVRSERKPNYMFEQEELLKKAVIQDEEDEIFPDVCEFVMEQGAASTSLIQRNFRIGYNRAARLIEMMEQQGIISEAKGSKPRDILISREEFDKLSGTSEPN